MSEQRPAKTTFSIHAHKGGEKFNMKIELYEARLWSKNIRGNKAKIHPINLFYLNKDYSGYFRIRINGIWKRENGKQFTFYTPAFIRQFLFGRINVLTFE